VDIGHTLLTIDALVHTTTGQPYLGFGVPSIDPAWWVADTGIAAVWAEKDAPDPPRVLPKLPNGDPDTDGYFHLSAPGPDLLGDIDGFSVLELWKVMGGSLSGVLEAYYLGSDAAEAAYHRRFRTFVDAHFGDPDPTGPVLFPGLARHFWVARIDRFNDLFFAASSSLSSPPPPPRQWPLTGQAFDRFLGWLYTGWASETARHP
jgi:hypothetical protein